MKPKYKKIYIEITNICNLNCPFCLSLNRKTQMMNLQEFNTVLDRIKGYTKYIYLHVKGEPLMHPLLGQFLDLAKEKEFQVNITTNGTLLDKCADILVSSSSVRQVNISMHALSEINSLYQEDYLKEVVKLIKNEERKFYLSLRFWLGNNLLKTFILAYLENELKIKIDINNEKEEIWPNVFLSSSEEFIWPSQGTSSKNFVMCHGIKDHIAILVDGTVVPCCLDGNGEIRLGNIFESSLEDIIQSERYRKMEKAFQNHSTDEQLCKKCTFKDKFT